MLHFSRMKNMDPLIEKRNSWWVRRKQHIPTLSSLLSGQANTGSNLSRSGGQMVSSPSEDPSANPAKVNVYFLVRKLLKIN